MPDTEVSTATKPSECSVCGGERIVGGLVVGDTVVDEPCRACCPPQPAYPIERPESDLRFTFGLSYEVAQLLVSHGYPSLNGDDLVRLQQALFGFIYKPGNVFGS